MTHLTRSMRMLAMAAALTVAGSSGAMAATTTTTLDVSPYFEVTGLAATLDFTGGQTFGDGTETRANSFTGINSGAGSSFEVSTNNSGGYQFSIAIDDMDGATYGDSVPSTAFNLQLTSSNGDTVDFTGGILTALGTYADYPGPESTDVLLWTCDGTCLGNDPLPEQYLAKIQLDVPALLADSYAGQYVVTASVL